MEAIVYAALEEICSQGVNGLPLPKLWPKLRSPLFSHGLHPCSNVKKSIWINLLDIPGLQFESQGILYDPQDELVRSFEESEMMNLKIIAPEHLRNSFVGIYDIKASDAGISQPQRRVLERLAIARTNGITQSELAKEFGMKGNNIFYVLRNLECRGLIVRQSTIIRKKETCNEGEPRNCSIVTTNMLQLYRYAKHLGCQQRLEITKEDENLVGSDNANGRAPSGDCFVEECVKENVHIKDYLPALKAVCDKLEKADGKVLVVSDIKRDLGYQGISGHRGWRNICNRLEDAGLVEKFCAKVNKKEVNCLRLLKGYSPKHFELKSHGCGFDDPDAEHPVKLGKRGQVTDQLVELPMEHQIYDMINAEGSKGLTITEVCKRLGVSNKRYYTRFLNMVSRFGMHLQAESYNRGKAYRVWTLGNFKVQEPNTVLSKPDLVCNENNICNPCNENHDFQESSAKAIQEVDSSTSRGDARATDETENVSTESELIQGSLKIDDNLLVCPSSSQNSSYKQSGRHPGVELQIVSATSSLTTAPLELSLPAMSTPQRRRSYQRYPCLTLGAVSAQREQRILEMLQEEKFLIKAELHRQLENFEKDKHTMMDRKTLDRCLNRLQQGGHCKCIRVSVPVVTNCGRSRTTDVVLHPSLQIVSPELLGQIHERLRSFEMQLRSHCSPRLKKGQSLPVLNGVQRIHRSGKLEVQAEKSEAMRANGFVLAKMVRTKLLHIFLWGNVSSLPGWGDALSSGKHGHDSRNPHSTCELFDLDAAIKAMPLKLFLQVVGSTQKFDDMIEKCRIGLCLSDLPLQEYKCLMDTQAMGRLSWLIDILRRLKLIRLVSSGHSEDAAKVPHATLTHALELRPYIEEPVSIVVRSSGCLSFDLRPQVRHDFVLSSRKAVDEYWRTLEYCFAAADSKAALHAFPGSSVHEVFFHRSWASVCVMTADQRTELLKRIVHDDPNKKLSFKDCDKIAKDLNLTLEQVLRVYHDKRQRCLTRLQGLQNSEGGNFQPLTSRHSSSARKRKKSSGERSAKHLKVDNVDGQSSEPMLINLPDTDDQVMEEHNFLACSLEHENHLHLCHIDDHVEAREEPESNEEHKEDQSFIRKCALSKLKPARQRKFLWTETADRQLVIEYVRHRAALGANFHRTDWQSLSDLPAPPDACKRRMALLNSTIEFRKALMRLCNMLSGRYAKFLEKFQSKPLNHGDGRVLVRGSASEEYCERSFSINLEEFESEERWDDFDENNIRIAVDRVLQYKWIANLEASNGVESLSDKSSDVVTNAEGPDLHDTELVSSASNREVQNCAGRNKGSGRRSSCHRLHRKYIKLLNEGTSVCRRAYESLAVSNAVELFKLIFLSSSTAPEVPNWLAETLRRYSEHDLLAAFDYLREKKNMVGGSGTSPFVLSQHFLRSISSSPFPTNTGKRAANFASWHHDSEKDLMEEGIDLPVDLQCGDIFHLCALVCSGELIISPCLPDEGVGDAEDCRTLKRKSDNEFHGGNAKKLKPLVVGEGEIISRREKGFPGIRLSLSRATISRVDAVEFFKDDFSAIALPFGEKDLVNTISCAEVGSISSHSDHMKETLNSGYTIPIAVAASESPWQAMTNYADHLFSLCSNLEERILFHPELFRTVHSAIQKTGDQGLSMEEISELINMQGENMVELIVEVLEAFGRILKVNAFDSIHVVDSLYQSKYCLSSMAAVHQDVKESPSTDFKGVLDDKQWILKPESHEDGGTSSQKQISLTSDELHRVTILNLPEEVAQQSTEIQFITEIESYKQSEVTSPRGDCEGQMFEPHSGDSHFCRPILPWINGDGTINEVVYKGLVRRVLGIVIQNPGILMDDLINWMCGLNPQSCRTLLEMMMFDNHIIVRKMHQTAPDEPPATLSNLLGSCFSKSKLICREHFFANPMSASLL